MEKISSLAFIFKLYVLLQKFLLTTPAKPAFLAENFTTAQQYITVKGHAGFKE